MLFFLRVLLLLLVGAPVVAVVSRRHRALQGGTITGYIDAVRKNNDGTYSVNGWACQVSVDASIQVEVFRDGADTRDGGVLWKRVTANKSSEAAVAAACGSSGRNYRFSIPITAADVAQYSGQSIYAHGVRSGNKALLNRSGETSFPTAPPTSIKGYVDSVSSTSNGQAQIRGWACQTGDASSIAVHVYAGGAAGSPGASLVLHATANQPSEEAVARACDVSSLRHRFQITVPNAAQFAGQKVYVHGISTRGTTNLAIDQSGEFSFPSAPSPPPPPPPTPAPPPSSPSLLSEIGFSNPSRRDIIIPRGRTVTIDTDLDVGLILVEGKLQCPSSQRSYEIKTEGIVVAGNGAELVCGASSNAASPVSLSIVLKGNRDASDIYGSRSLGPKAVVVTDGGVARLHGVSGREGFTYLRQTAQPGATSIRLLRNVEWKVGDTVVIAPTDFSPHEAEERTVASVSGSTVTLDRGLTYRHWGATESYTNGKGQSWTLDERAAVFVINRNIRIGSENDAATRSSRPTGGHFIVQRGGEAFVDNVEFYRMGQAGIIARYPFHWHRLGNVAGQYVSAVVVCCRAKLTHYFADPKLQCPSFFPTVHCGSPKQLCESHREYLL